MATNHRLWQNFGLTGLALALVAGLSACGGSGGKLDYPETTTYIPGGVQPDEQTAYTNDKQSSVFGPGGLFGGGKDNNKEGGGGIGVNAFLWRASLDTLSFLPLSSADPFGGVIITDWYSPAQSPTERFKLNVFILDRTLRADSIRVSIFRQVQASSGEWLDQPVDPKMAVDMENTILTRARELRVTTRDAKS